MSVLERRAVSPKEAAAYLSISKRALSKLIASGRIAARKLGRRTLVDVAALDVYFESLPIKTGSESIPNAPQVQP